MGEDSGGGERGFVYNGSRITGNGGGQDFEGNEALVEESISRLTNQRTLGVRMLQKIHTHTHIEFTSNGSKYFPGQFYKFDVRVSVFLEKFEHPKYVGL